MTVSEYMCIKTKCGRLIYSKIPEKQSGYQQRHKTVTSGLGTWYGWYNIEEQGPEGGTLRKYITINHACYALLMLWMADRCQIWLCMWQQQLVCEYPSKTLVYLATRIGMFGRLTADIIVYDLQNWHLFLKCQQWGPLILLPPGNRRGRQCRNGWQRWSLILRLPSNICRCCKLPITYALLSASRNTCSYVVLSCIQVYGKEGWK